MWPHHFTVDIETQGALLRVTKGAQDRSPPWLRSQLPMLTLPLFSCVTLGKFLTLSEPHLSNGDSTEDHAPKQLSPKAALRKRKMMTSF